MGRRSLGTEPRLVIGTDFASPRFGLSTSRVIAMNSSYHISKALVKFISRSSFKIPNYFGHFYFPIILSEVHFNTFIVLGLADSWTTLCVLETPISSRGNINDPP